ncbi:hypothetical protein A6770_33030 [Nostoc minutum NIES-26]|uniref:Uncharacterized protein n=1 Tax=Nostoc minutum NIES-26 TaxID=1844469 RepID=A0A367Q5R5_9NOSO|nr:hypothetical protein A6770_33030 [Nostoc minutum NIES-26]
MDISSNSRFTEEDRLEEKLHFLAKYLLCFDSALISVLATFYLDLSKKVNLYLYFYIFKEFKYVRKK